jgi:hypothetical protein
MFKKNDLVEIRTFNVEGYEYWRQASYECRLNIDDEPRLLHSVILNDDSKQRILVYNENIRKAV